MAISDLTGTTWTINSTTCTAGYGIFYLDYMPVEYGGELSQLGIGYQANPQGYSQLANNVVYGSTFINASVGDTIEILGGTDATNSTLISWLEANAVQITVTDLTGTTWKINSTTCTAGYGQFDIDFAYNEPSADYGDQTRLDVGYSIDRPPNVSPTANSILTFSSFYEVSVGDTLKFFSGTDVTNSTLIAWLEANATNVTPTSSDKIHIGSLPLSKSYCNGNVEKIVLNGSVLYST